MYHPSHVLGQQLRVFAHQDIRAHFHGLDMFGITVEGDTGHAVERRLLGHIARVGHDAQSMGGEIAEVEVAERSGDDDAWLRQLAVDTTHHFSSLTAQRCHDGHIACLLHHSGHHGLEVVGVGEQRLAVEGEHHIVPVTQPQLFHTRRTCPTAVVEAQ